MNQRQKYVTEWQLISFLALDYEEQLNLIGDINSDYSLKLLDDKSNYFLQVLLMLLYYSDSDFFPHVYEIGNRNTSEYNGSLECLCLFVHEKIFYSDIDISKININLFIGDFGGDVWIFIRKMARNGLKEIDLCPYNFKKPLKIVLPKAFNESQIHTRGKIYF